MWRGERCYPTLALRPTAANIKHAARLRESILREIDLGTFRMEEHFPEYRAKSQSAAQIDDSSDESCTFERWSKIWAGLAARELEHSTLSIYKRHLSTYWGETFNELRPRQIKHRAVLERLAELSSDRIDEKTGKVRKGLSRKTQNNILIPLRAVFQLACKSLPGLVDPTDGIDNLKVQKGDPDPFSASEAEEILLAMQEVAGPEFKDYFEFAMFAGLRPSEQIALLWDDVDLERGTALVRRARVMGKDKERTKTHVERLVELNLRSLAVMRRQAERTKGAGKEVFFNPATGRAYVDDQKQHEVWVATLATTSVRYRPPKECRDTSVTLALAAGANPTWVSKQHGHSLQVMMRDYAKWIPDSDRGSNLAAVNRSLAPSEGAPQ